jgi:diaminopimelate decarboxylase
MHDFSFRNVDLYCEETKVADIVEKFGTPVYIYSYRTIINHYRKLDRAFQDLEHLICYSVKANPSLAICKALANEGSGFDIVSGGELYRILKIGADPQKIVFAGVGKTASEIEYALKSNILLFNVESFSELLLLNEIAQKLERKAPIALRVNPDVDPGTHHYITTGRRENKFGVDLQLAPEMLEEARKLPGIEIMGVHAHIGSQITSVEPYFIMVERVLSLIEELRRQGFNLSWMNIGGGMGIVYHDETPSTAEELAQALLPNLKKAGLKIIIEPGRFIVGNAGILVTKVLYWKKTAGKEFVIVDAGMNDLIRPALYQAYHHITPITMLSHPEVIADIVGPVCESGDFFAHDRKIRRVEPGEYLAIMSAGAYGFSMSSNYNSRPRGPEVMVINQNYYMIRERESYLDLIDRELVLPILQK